MAKKHWSHFHHGADIGVRGVGGSKEEAFEQAAGEVEDDGGAVGADGGGVDGSEAGEELAGGAFREGAAFADGGMAGCSSEETMTPVGGVGERFAKKGKDAVLVEPFEAGGSATNEHGAAAELFEDEAE